MRKPVPFNARDRVGIYHFAILALSYALALAFYGSAAREQGGDPYFAGTYFGAVGASILISLLAAALPSADWRRFLIGLRCYLLVVMGYSIESFLSTKLVLGLGLMAEIAILIEYPRNVLGAALALAILLAAQAWPHFFGTERLGDSVPVPEAAELAVLAFNLGAFALLTIWILRLSARQRDLIAIIHGQDSNLDTMSELNSKLQGYARTVDEEAAERERNRISREIHDVSGYIFTNLIALMDAAGSLKRDDSASLSDLILTARSQAKEGLRETRAALHRLRMEQPGALDCTRAIHKIVSIFRKTTCVDIEVNYGNLPRFLSRELSMALIRTIQEALTNCVRHGKVSAVRIGFWVREERILLTIADDGRGALEVVKGIGLTGMEERMQLLGGSVCIGVSPLGGFSLSVDVPVSLAPSASSPPARVEGR